MQKHSNRSALAGENRQGGFPNRDCTPNPALIYRYIVTIDAGRFLVHLHRALEIGEGNEALAGALRKESGALILKGAELVANGEFLELLRQSSKVVFSSAGRMLGAANACEPVK